MDKSRAVQARIDGMFGGGPGPGSARRCRMAIDMTEAETRARWAADDARRAERAEALDGARGVEAPATVSGDILRRVPARGELVEAMLAEAWKGKRAARCRDVFDDLEQCDGRGALSSECVAAGRRYAALAERVQGAGYVLSRVGREASGGAAPRDAMDAYIADVGELQRMRLAVGHGMALEVQRLGGRRAPIPALSLVDMVCLRGMALGPVLRAYGWGEKGATRAALRQALAEALLRMARAPQHVGD